MSRLGRNRDSWSPWKLSGWPAELLREGGRGVESEVKWVKTLSKEKINRILALGPIVSVYL